MIRKIIAATCLFAALTFAVPASADGYRHGHWGGYGKHYNYKHYRHGGAAVFAGGLLLGALIGHLAAPPRTVYAAPPRQPVLGNCRIIYGTGYVNGRLAEYSGTGCYDAYGNLYATPGSERFLRYLD
jgi:hypothetical protein